jgi:uncharacterized protein with von Willebrand factor type A (vWA) domain
VTETLDLLVAFAQRLRAEGVRVGTSKALDFCRAADLADPRDLYWAGRVSLVSRREDIETYDRVFREFFADPASDLSAPGPELPPDKPDGAGTQPSAVRRMEEVEGALASSLDVICSRSFADCTPEELAELARFLARRRMQLPPRRTRRLAPGGSRVPDLRRTLRHSFRTGGDPFTLAWRERRMRPRRLVLLLDVSRSMTAYSRGLLLFAHAAVRANRSSEAFCFGTRLTRVTSALARTSADEALQRAVADVVDWDGGTCIGDAVKRFLDDFGHRGMARGAIVVIASDGLDAGEPELLQQQMARLARHAHRVVWLNPLAESALYQPLARGMQAALPYVDVFASGHNADSLFAMEKAVLAS